MFTFGDFFKQRRIARKKVMRIFCLENKLDYGNHSRLERGLCPPPQREEILIRYAKMLGIEEKSDDWHMLFDLAAIENGHIPKDLIHKTTIQDWLTFFSEKRQLHSGEDKKDGK